MGSEPLRPEDFTWTLASADVRKAIRGLRKRYSAIMYEEIKHGLRKLICNYVNAGDLADRMGDSICPIGGGKDGERWYKMRCPLPGMGKSGSLRLGVSINIEAKLVKIAYVAVRADDPALAEFLAALATTD